MADLLVSLGKISANVDNSLAEVQSRNEATQAQLSALHSTILSINSCKCETGKAPRKTPVSGKLETKKPWNPNFQRV
ncbi:hypothetical protein CEP52_015524 [Fusarium oligoseptatum]|uniref:Uncharacterized protein n=2 Tax=Fusarium solani species complex TaxID=232080 RepID=A0A428SCG5_9HYPO|nr:hypothetical protein CEP52_015524 [Fusarium oligoseptatum]RSL92391.1 hypothetical protein CDV31_015176 [Fusarium ambrosium]